MLRIASTLVVDPSTARLLYEVSHQPRAHPERHPERPPECPQNANASPLPQIFGFSLAVYSTILSVGLLRLFSRASRPFGVLVIAIDRMIRSIDM